MCWKNIYFQKASITNPKVKQQGLINLVLRHLIQLEVNYFYVGLIVKEIAKIVLCSIIMYNNRQQSCVYIMYTTD